MLFKLQAAPYTDFLTDDGTELTKLPYPFYVDERGIVTNPHNGANKVMGFVKDLNRQKIDLWWPDALNDPQKIVGMYMVAANNDNRWATQLHAIDTVEVN